MMPMKKTMVKECLILLGILPAFLIDRK